MNTYERKNMKRNLANPKSNTLRSKIFEISMGIIYFRLL